MSKEVQSGPPESTVDAAALQRLHELTIAVEDFDTAIERLLSLGCDHFGLETGILSDIDDDRYEVEAVVDSTGAYETGAIHELGETMCRVTVAGDSTETVAFGDVTDTEYDDHPAADDGGVRAYIAAPVFVDGAVYGTVNFSSPVPRDEPFHPGEREFVKLVAGWIGNEIERCQRRRELEWYEQMVDAADEMMYVADEEGRFRVVNDAFVDFFEVDEETVIGSTVNELSEAGSLPPGILEQRREAVAEFRHSDELQTTVEIEHEMDVTRTFECRLAKMRPDDAAYVSVIRDVTERKDRERELETEREWQEAIFEGSRDAIFVSDRDAKFVDVNAAAAELTGYDREELLSMRIPDLHEETDLDAYREFHDRILAGEPATTEAELLCADGSKVPAEFSNRRIEVDGDAYMHTVARDVTERKERERELKRYEALVNAAEDPMFALTSDRRFSLVNDRFLELADLEREDVIDEPSTVLIDHDVVDVETIREWRTAYQQLVDSDDGKAVFEFEVDLPTTSERRIFEAHVVLFDDEQKHSVTICRDITTRTEREVELRRERNRLAHLKEVVTSVQPLTERITSATSREDLEEAVCECLADSSVYTGAWIGEYSELHNQVQPRVAAGLPEGYFDAIDDVGQPGTPVDRAVVTGEPQVLEEGTSSLPIERGFHLETAHHRSMAVIPLVYRSTTHGVLGVHSGREEAFGERELAVLAGLGRRVGHAISALKHRQLLQSDSTIELRFGASPPAHPPFSIATTCGCTLSVANLVRTDEDSCLFHFRVEGSDPGHVEATFDDLSGVAGVRTLRAEDDAGIIQCEFTGENPLALLVDNGAVVRSARATDQETTIAVEMAPGTDVRAVVEAVESTFPGFEFVSQREHDTPEEQLLLPGSSEPWESLTERQQQVLEAAYYAGYYEWPRTTTAEQLADALGVSAPTLHQHIRKAHGRLIDGLVDRNVIS